MFSGILQQFNPFMANVSILFPLKTPENQRYFESTQNSIQFAQVKDGKKENVKIRETR